MEQKVKQGLSNPLLQAREESLRKMNQTSIRPHGKLWGMDVFSWNQPSTELLVNTIHTFPFPLVWVGNYETINDTLKRDESLIANLDTILFHDSSKLRLSINHWLEIKNMASVRDINDALRLLPSFKRKHSVLLFTTDGANWEDTKERIEDFIKLHQI